MSRPCSVCVHPNLAGINVALTRGKACSVIAREHGLGDDSVTRHRKHVQADIDAYRLQVIGELSEQMHQAAKSCRKCAARTAKRHLRRERENKKPLTGMAAILARFARARREALAGIVFEPASIADEPPALKVEQLHTCAERRTSTTIARRIMKERQEREALRNP